MKHTTKLYGEMAYESINKELDQMQKKGVFEFVESVPPVTDVLRSQMFLNMKSNGLIKARLVAGGDSMNKSIYGKDVRSPPTVHVENLFSILG